MLGSFRLAMTWLHTWFGLVLGFVLMVAFFFGSLAIFAPEIDRWALPETRFESRALPSFDQVLKPLIERLEPEGEELQAVSERLGGPLDGPLPPLYWSVDRSNRGPFVWLYAEMKVDNPKDEQDHAHVYVPIDPRSGKRVTPEGLALGSDFFYPMHYSLHLHWYDLGIWLIGLAALVMLVALFSGVVIHRKLLRELFTFRPEKKGQRRVLDLHNLTGVVALPFHFLFAFTGLLIFAGIYLPFSETMLQPLHDHHEALESRAKRQPNERAGIAAALAPVDPMIAEARRLWAASGKPAELGGISINNVGDVNSYVSVYPLNGDRMTFGDQAIRFEAKSGRRVDGEPAPSAIGVVAEYLAKLHLMPFEHWALRWLFVSGGLTGCTCIATGLVFFVGKRKRKHAQQGISGARWVDALSITSVTGMLVATTAMLVVCRAFPGDLPDRGEWEERVFWLTWVLSFIHAAIRTARVSAGGFAPAWREQCWVVAVLAASAAVLNWITTGDHLSRTVARRDWAVAGFDLVLLTTAAVAGFAARGLKRHELAQVGGPTDSSGESPSESGFADPKAR